MRKLTIAQIALWAALLLPGGAFAEVVVICYNYGCNSRGQVDFGEAHFAELGGLLAGAADASAERALISLAIGRMYAVAGGQTPVWRDKGGNLQDGGENGQMDCIDHSTYTTAFLRLLKRRGWLRFHEVLEPLRRARFFVFAEHWAAQIREPGANQAYAVDSWYVDNGRPVPVLSVDAWRKGRISEMPPPAVVAHSTETPPPGGK
jgi:hypothetical protein